MAIRLHLQTGDADGAVALIRQLFSQRHSAGGIARLKYPAGSVVKGYVVLGDAAMIVRRFATAEAYYR